MPKLCSVMDRFRAPKGHISDPIQLVYEKHGINANGDGRHLASCDRSNGVRLFLPAMTVTDHRFLMSGRERFSQLSMDHEMMTGFSHRIDVDEKILIVDGDLDAITLL